MRDERRGDFSHRQRRDMDQPYISPGGTQTVIIQPIDVCSGIGAACECALSEVVASNCGGIAAGTEIEVWDLCRNYFNLPESLLFESLFVATKFSNAPGLTFPSGYPPEGSCIWIVTDILCCVEEV